MNDRLEWILRRSRFHLAKLDDLSNDVFDIKKERERNKHLRREPSAISASKWPSATSDKEECCSPAITTVLMNNSWVNAS